MTSLALRSIGRMTMRSSTTAIRSSVMQPSEATKSGFGTLLETHPQRDDVSLARAAEITFVRDPNDDFRAGNQEILFL